MEKTKNSEMLSIVLKIGGVLTIICASVALVLSAVNLLTFNKINENIENEKMEAIISLYGSEDISTRAVDFQTGVDGVHGLFEVSDGDELLGYCVNIASPGFGGDVEMMVAVDMSTRIAGIKIVTMSETPGLGTRISESSFISQFIGSGSAIIWGDGIDAISGSTISSEAVREGAVGAVLAVEKYVSGGVR